MMRTLLLLLSVVVIRFMTYAQDVSLDNKLGVENAAMVEQEMGIYHHDSLYHLVNAVGNKLVSRLKTNPFQFKFFIADTHEPNAFALPGGYIYVTRGILILLQSEDELAGIMAHEIIHVTQRHSVKQLKKGLISGLLKVPGNAVNAITGTKIGNVINAPIDFSTKAFIAKYSRGHETEADSYGIQLAASAGYRTDALADALVRLTREVTLLTGEEEQKSYFSDHPFTPQRVTSIRKSASLFKPVNPSPITNSDDAFIQRFNGLCFGDNPAQGVFLDSIFVHPDLGFVWFAPGDWQTMNKPSIVASYTEKGDAITTLKTADPKVNPKELMEKITAESQKNPGLTVLSNRDTIINSYPAYLLRLKSTSNDQPAIMELIWLHYNKNIVFQLMGVSTPSLQEKTHQALCSFRMATLKEKELVKLFELKVVQVKANETLEKVSQRTGNKLKTDFMAVINNYEPNQSLKEGALLKVVTASPYVSKN